MKIEIDAEVLTSSVDLPETKAGTKFLLFRGVLIGLAEDQSPTSAMGAMTTAALSPPEVIEKMTNMPRERLSPEAVAAIKAELLRVLSKAPGGLTSRYACDALGMVRRDDRARQEVMNIARSMVGDGILEIDKSQSERFPSYRVRGLVKQPS